MPVFDWMKWPYLSVNNFAEDNLFLRKFKNFKTAAKIEILPVNTKQKPILMLL